MGWRCWWNGRRPAIQTTVVQRRSPWRTRITKIQVQQKNGWSRKASWTTSCWESITCLGARNLKIKFQMCIKPTRKQKHSNHQRVEGFPKTHGWQDASIPREAWAVQARAWLPLALDLGRELCGVEDEAESKLEGVYLVQGLWDTLNLSERFGEISVWEPRKCILIDPFKISSWERKTRKRNTRQKSQRSKRRQPKKNRCPRKKKPGARSRQQLHAITT